MSRPRRVRLAACLLAAAALTGGFGSPVSAQPPANQPPATPYQAPTTSHPPGGILIPRPAIEAAQAGGPVRRLSVDEAVALALEQNLNVRVQRLNPQVQDLNVALARSAWTPNATTSFTLNQRTDQNTGFLSGGIGTATIGTDSVSNSVGVNQQLPWGGGFTVSWNSSRTSTDSIFENFNPQLRSSLVASFRQPLLRDFRIDAPRQQLLVSQRNREISDIQLRQTVLATVRNVRNAYWELSYAVSSLETNRQSLELARQSLKDNRARVEIGTMAPIEIVAAEAEVAQREEAVILAEAAVEQAQDQLRALILDPETPGFWTTRFEPTDRPVFQARPIDVDRAIREALDKRTDIRQAMKNLETSDINIRFYQNQKMPDLNLQVDYTSRGTGGTQLESIRGLTDPGPRAVIGRRSYGDVLADLLTSDYPIWQVSVQVAYPLGTSSAEANLARARLQYQQSQLQLRNLTLQIAQQVRDASRQVNTNLKRVEATRASRELAERRLEAEQKKFAAGMSTNFQIFQAQRDLAAARTAELRAILDYNRALVDFETVQEAPLAGGGITIVP